MQCLVLIGRKVIYGLTPPTVHRLHTASASDFEFRPGEVGSESDGSAILPANRRVGIPCLQYCSPLSERPRRTCRSDTSRIEQSARPFTVTDSDAIVLVELLRAALVINATLHRNTPESRPHSAEIHDIKPEGWLLRSRGVV